MVRRRRPVIIEVLAGWRWSEAMGRRRRAVEVFLRWRRSPVIVRLGYSPCGGEDEHRGAREECTHVISVKCALTGHEGT